MGQGFGEMMVGGFLLGIFQAGQELESINLLLNISGGWPDVPPSSYGLCMSWLGFLIAWWPQDGRTTLHGGSKFQHVSRK